jgi:hypothetical protein
MLKHVRALQGACVWPNGDTYQGEWQDNRMHGKGEFHWKDRQCRYKGEVRALSFHLASHRKFSPAASAFKPIAATCTVEILKRDVLGKLHFKFTLLLQSVCFQNSV